MDINETAETRHQLFEELLTQFKIKTEKYPDIDKSVLSNLIGFSVLISNIQNIGLSQLKEQIWLRLATSGELAKLEQEQKKIYKLKQ